MEKLNRNLFILIIFFEALILTSFSSDFQNEADPETIAVQILALRDSIPARDIQQQYQINMPVHLIFLDGYYKYWIGPYNSVEKANDFLDELISKSKIKEAFVVRFSASDLKVRKNIQVKDSVTNNVLHPDTGLSLFESNGHIKNLHDSMSVINSAFHNDAKQDYIAKIVKTRLVNYKSKHVLWVVISYFLLLSLLTISFVLFSRTYNQRLSKKREALKDQYQLEIAEYLFNEMVSSIPESLQNIYKRGRRQLLIDEIVRLQSDLSGEVLEKVKKLYEELELYKDSMAKLEEIRWDKKARGMRELSVMGVVEAIPLIEKYTNDRNDVLRSEAFLALTKIQNKDPLYFLNRKDIFLSLWNQLNLHVAMQRSDIDIPEFKQWLHSENESILLFTIKMASLYNQFDAASEIARLLQHHNPKIRNSAIRALGDMEAYEYSGLLAQQFADEIYDNRLEIIRSIGLIGNDEESGFLHQLILNETDFDTLLLAVKSLYALGNSGKAIIAEVLSIRNNELKEIVNHVYDLRI